MPIGGSKAKMFTAMSLLVLGYGTCSNLRADIVNCNDYYGGRCYQWCADGGANPSACTVDTADNANCYCTDGSHTVL